jgi:hypothetical protein
MGRRKEGGEGVAAAGGLGIDAIRLSLCGWEAVTLHAGPNFYPEVRSEPLVLCGEGKKDLWNEGIWLQFQIMMTLRLGVD